MAFLLMLTLMLAPAWAVETVSLNKTRAGMLAPVIKFKDDKDNIRTLAPQQDKLTIVHFWATWCSPCVKELPDVNATQWAYGNKELKIITISLDGDGKMDKVVKFFEDNKISQLKPYLDVSMASYNAVRAKSLPTTLFIDKAGKEVARAEGVLNWNSSEVTDLINHYVK